MLEALWIPDTCAVVERGGAHRDAEDLASRLVEAIAGRSPLEVVHDGNGSRSEVLMRFERDGECYTLMRTHAAPAPGGPDGLSPREREIIRLVARGLSNKGIAAVLDISPWTVCTHLRRMFVKLGVNSRTEMVAHALRQQIL